MVGNDRRDMLRRVDSLAYLHRLAVADVVRSKPLPFQIRAYDMVVGLLERMGLSKTPEGNHAIKCLKGPADRARRRMEKKAVRSLDPLTPDRDAWTKQRKKTDAVFSLYIRLRDTTGPWEDRSLRSGYCCTCRQLKRWSDLQCGHWKKRELWGTRWHPWNSHAQCRYCNDKHRGGGMEPQHEAFIEKTMGREAVDRICTLVMTEAFKPSIERLEQIEATAVSYIEKLRLRNAA